MLMQLIQVLVRAGRRHRKNTEGVHRGGVGLRMMVGSCGIQGSKGRMRAGELVLMPECQ